MSSLWKDVVEGAVETEQSSVDTAAIEAMISDDASTMVEYVSGCTEGMVALEAAVAMAEGRNAVKYATATESVAKEEAVAAMEGVLSDAWESLKNMAEKAWKAIKAFIQKAWNKMKGYANVVKAFFTKYGKVIKGKNVDFKVAWCEITLNKGLAEATKLVGEVQGLTRGANNPALNQSNQDYYNTLHTAFFPKGEDSVEVDWSSKKAEAIKVADQGLDSLYQGMFKLGDKSERDIIKDIKDEQKRATAHYEKNSNDDDDKADYRAFASKKTRLAIYVVRTMASMGHRAASRLYNQSVKACRAAIRAEAATKESYAPSAESATLDAFMSEIL